MLRRFFKYLLVGCSAMALLAGANFALAAEIPSQWECERALARGENICNDNITYCEATGWQDGQVVSAVLKSKEQGVCNPSHGERDARGCIFQFLNVRGFNYSTPQDASLFGAASACPAETAPTQAPAAPVCERKDVIGTVEDCVGSQVCTFNIWQGPKADGSCQTGRGGAFNCRTVAGQCGVPAQQQVVTGTCYVCDGDTWRQAGGVAMSADECSKIDNALFNQPNKPAWCQAPQQQPAPPAPAAPPTPPAAPAASATGGSATGGSSSATGGSSTVTINNPATTTREVVRETTRVVTAGNVGVGTTVISGQVLGVKELPKTGLPALAWSALVFIPTGFGLRRFSKVKGDLQNHPSYIFDMRQFKFGS